MCVSKHFSVNFTCQGDSLYEAFVDCSINSCAEVTGSDDRILLFYSPLSNTRAHTHKHDFILHG